MMAQDIAKTYIALSSKVKLKNDIPVKFKIFKNKIILNLLRSTFSFVIIVKSLNMLKI